MTDLKKKIDNFILSSERSNMIAGDKYYKGDNVTISLIRKNISKKVKDATIIPFHQYGNLLRYLVAINFNLEIDTSSLISLLLENLNGKGDSVDLHSLFSYIHFEEDPEFRKELEN